MDRWLRRLRRLRGREDGQVLILVAGSMVLILGFAALVVDGGHAFVVKRSLQNAVDAASLAAATVLPLGGGLTCENGNSSDLRCGGASGVEKTAEQYLASNGFTAITLVPCIRQTSPREDGLIPAGAAGCYMTPYNGLPEVLIVVGHQVSTFFGGAIGIPNINVSARAAAIATPVTSTTFISGTTVNGTTINGTTINGTTNPGTTIQGTTIQGTTIAGTTNAGSTVYSTNTSTTTTGQSSYAFFTSDMSCAAGKGIDFEKNNATVNGFIHANSNIALSGNNNTVAAASYGQAGCPPTGSVFTKAPVLDGSYNTPPNPPPWPVPWNQDTTATICSGADYKGTPPVVGGTPTLSGSYAGGIWCNLSGTIDVQGPPTSGKLTVVAQTITVSGNNQTFPAGDYTKTFSNGTWSLLFYATGAAGIDISGNSNTLPGNGFLFAPSGPIILEKNNGANGFWESQDIDIKFNNFSMTGSGPLGGGTTSTTTTTIPVTTIAGTTNGGSTIVGSTNAGSTGTGTATPTTTIQGTTNPGSTTPSSTQTSTTGTNVGLGE